MYQEVIRFFSISKQISSSPPVSPLEPAKDNRVGLTFRTTKPANDVDLFSVLPEGKGRADGKGG